MFGCPTVRYRVCAILGPLPVRASIESCGKISNLTFVFSVTIEILGSRQCTRDHEGRIDCREFAIKRTATCLHVKKVIVETFVSRGVRFRTLRALPEETKGGQRSANRIFARNETTLDADRVGSQSKPGWSDTAWRALPSAVRHQAVLRIRFLQKIVKRKALELFKLAIRKGPWPRLRKIRLEIRHGEHDLQCAANRATHHLRCKSINEMRRESVSVDGERIGGWSF